MEEAGIQGGAGTAIQVRLLLPQAVITTPEWGSYRRCRTPKRVPHQNGSSYCHFWHTEESCCSNSYPHKCISYSRGEFVQPLSGDIFKEWVRSSLMEGDSGKQFPFS